MFFKSKRSQAQSRRRWRERKNLHKPATTEATLDTEISRNGQKVQQVDILEENLIEEEFTIYENTPTETFNDPLLEPAVNNVAQYSSAASPFCALCLHKCPVESSIDISASECRGKLESTLCLQIDYENCTICQTCWKLVETFSMFRVCCQKAVSWSERNSGQFLYNKEDDDSWISTDNAKAIDITYQAIQSRIEWIESNELTAEDLALKIEIDDSVQYMDSIAEVANNDTDVQELESQANPSSVTRNQTDTCFVVDVKLCRKCWMWFGSKDEFTLHSQQCTAEEGKKPKDLYYNCKMCSAAFKKIRALKCHLSLHKGVKPLKCRKRCNEQFRSDATRYRHEMSCGLFEQGYKTICPVCGILVKHCQLPLHLAYHDKAKSTCSICGKKFSEDRMERHMLVHTGARNHPCAVCGKAFKSSYAARVHQRIHTQEKPFVCSVCGCAFPYKCSLQAHVKKHHAQRPATICE